MQNTLLTLLEEGYPYASSFQASKTFGKDIKKAREYIMEPLKEGDPIQVTARASNGTKTFISIGIERPKETNLLSLINKLEIAFTESYAPETEKYQLAHSF